MNPHYIQTLLDTSIKTVEVIFFNQNRNTTVEMLNGKHQKYTYKTRLDVKPEDFVIVLVNEEVKIVMVTDVHDVPNIDSDSKINYKWILQKIDLDAYKQSEIDDSTFNAEIRSRGREHHAATMRKVLAESYGDLSNLLSAPKAPTV